MSVIDFNEFYIGEIVLIRAFQRAIKRRDTISGTLISSFKRQLAKILWNRGSTEFIVRYISSSRVSLTNWRLPWVEKTLAHHF